MIINHASYLHRSTLYDRRTKSVELQILTSMRVQIAHELFGDGRVYYYDLVGFCCSDLDVLPTRSDMQREVQAIDETEQPLTKEEYKQILTRRLGDCSEVDFQRAWDLYGNSPYVVYTDTEDWVVAYRSFLGRYPNHFRIGDLNFVILIQLTRPRIRRL